MSEDEPDVDASERVDVDDLLAASTDYKVRGKDDIVGGAGVVGYNTASSGESYGVEGVTDSADKNAAGVRASAPNGGTGVFASANSNSAVYGNSFSGQGGSFATVIGSTAVLAQAAAQNTTHHGVEGLTEATGQSSAGVRGVARGGSGQTYGVYGETASNQADAAGVRGVGNGDAPAVSASGHVDVSKVGVAAYRLNNQTVPDSTITTVAFDTLENSRDDFGGLDTSTGVYTVQRDGDYHIDFQIKWDSIFEAGDVIRYRLFINGAYTNGIDAETYAPNGSPTRSFSKALLGLSAGDELEVRVSQYSGSDKDIEGGTGRTQLSIHRIG